MSMLRVCAASGCGTNTLGALCIEHEVPGAASTARPSLSLELLEWRDLPGATNGETGFTGAPLLVLLAVAEATWWALLVYLTA
jgi:hypothetical protein